MPKRLLALVLVCGLLITSGCVAAAVGAGAGAGTYAFVKGKTVATIDSPYNDVWEAAGATLREYEITVTSDTRDAMGGSYKGERHDGSNVVVDIRSLARNSTEVSVRIGAFGDRTFQEQFLDNVRQRL